MMMTHKSPCFIRRILAIMLFCCGSELSYAQEDVQDDFYFLTYTIEKISGDSVRLIPEKGNPLTGRISKKADLNFDGLDDFIINFGQCGNWGDCLYGIYVQQADQKYKSVFLPEYGYSGKWDLLENECTQVDGV